MKTTIILAVSASTLAIAGNAFAQDMQPSDEAEPQSAQPSQGLQEIIVTAQKRSESLNDVPLSITAASGDQLADQGITDVADLVKVVPGFTYTESAYATPVYTLRGVGFYDTSLAAKPTVSVYQDQVPIPFSIIHN